MSVDQTRKLKSSDPRERLIAARYLAKHADAKHTQMIENALAVETVGWVISALKRAQQRVRPSDDIRGLQERPELSPDQTAQIYSDALETTAKQIIHEIEPILGTLRLSAEAEISEFEASDTKRALERMEALVAGLSRLRQAASAPRVAEFELDQCIHAWIAEQAVQKPVNVLRAGPLDITVDGDTGLVCLAFVNGLRNAIDATRALPDDAVDSAAITVNWGVTDVDAWIAIVDGGIGFRGNLAKAFEIGSTTKAGHLGMGLATAPQAMTSLGGSVRLIPGDRGVRFEMRWPGKRA